jgi:hypothetical protein
MMVGAANTVSVAVLLAEPAVDVCGAATVVTMEVGFVPAGKGEPGTSASAPVVGLMVYAEMSPDL